MRGVSGLLSRSHALRGVWHYFHVGATTHPWTEDCPPAGVLSAGSPRDPKTKGDVAHRREKALSPALGYRFTDSPSSYPSPARGEGTLAWAVVAYLDTLKGIDRHMKSQTLDQYPHQKKPLTSSPMFLSIPCAAWDRPVIMLCV